MERAHLLGKIFNTPLMIMPAKASVIADVIMHGEIGSSEAALANVSPEAKRALLGPAREPSASAPYALNNGTAVVRIVGTLINRGAWVGANSGLISYEGIRTQLTAARTDPDVRSVILDLETPGGEAIGAFEATEAVRALAAEKPVIAVVDGLACSAGYALASAATKIVTTPSGISGSIGVVILHMDHSRKLAADGLKPTLIFAGAHKTDGNPYEPLPASVRAELQQESELFRSLFVDCVARGRRMSAEAIRATEGRVYVGQAAVDAGLCDEIGTIEAVFASLSSGPMQQQPPAGVQASAVSMADRMREKHGLAAPEVAPGSMAARMAERFQA